MYKLSEDELKALIYDARYDMKSTADELIQKLPKKAPATKIVIRTHQGQAASFNRTAEIEGKDFTKVWGNDPHELIGKVVLSFENFFDTKVEWK